MHTRSIIFSIMLGLLISCGKDDGSQMSGPNPDPQNEAPSPFALLTPESGEESAPRTPTFIWVQATDPNGDAVTYDIYIDRESEPMTLIASNLNTTTYTQIENLDLGTQYHWKVVAKDAKGAETESAVGSFTTNLPIVFLKEFRNMLGEGLTVAISYTNGSMDFFDINGTGWAPTYDISSGKLTRLSLGRNGTNWYDYRYTLFDAQQNVRSRGELSEEWLLDYDGQEWLASVLYTTANEQTGTTTTMATFKYPDNKASRPDEIALVTIRSDSPETDEITAGLEWDSENIMSIQYEGTENGEPLSAKIEYTYDNNINPYYIILKNQFGFDDFFVLNLATEMETINFGPFFWQSRNNIVKTELVQTSVKGGGSFMESDTYEYIYSEDFYPLAAIRVHTGGMAGEETIELKWSY